MINVTLFAGFKRCMGDTPLIDALYDIRNGKYATEINRIRAFMDAGNQDEADMLKKKLPAITVSATYQKQRLPKYMTGYNPLTILDFDELNKEDLPRLLALVREAVYTVACWISPRGRGIKIIVYPAVGTELIPANHLAVYKQVKDWYERLLGVGADASGSDAGRLCIVSYDQQLYLSPRFEPWLKGEGTLPAGLPPIEAGSGRTVSQLISSARRKASRKFPYAEYNPFKSYFDNLPRWDGTTDPIGRLAATVDTTRPEYWEKCLKKWLVAVVACAIDERQTNHAVLLLSGAQGLGKTTWLRNLVPPVLRNYVFSGNLDPTAKDSSLLMSDCFLIILDELSGQSRVELNQLKALITKDSILERRPYARNAETFVRRASFAATVNDSQILTDRTGSRRFLCFETLRIDYTSEIDHAAIYAQALALYKQNFRYWFAENDITEINDNNEPFQQSCPEAELFYTYFRKPVRFELPLLLSASEILSKIAERTRYSMTTMSVNLLGRVLKGGDFESQKRHGKRLYAVMELSHDQVEARRKGFGYDPSDEGEGGDNKDDGNGERPDPQLPF